jgi:hypothetical protein
MILTIPLTSYNKHFLIFNPAVKNMLMEYSMFIRIFYSTHNITFNGIFLQIYNKPAHLIYDIEKDILQSYPTKKQPVYSIEKQMAKHSNTHVLKISGIWENDTSYGLVFKFIM